MTPTQINTLAIVYAFLWEYGRVAAVVGASDKSAALVGLRGRLVKDFGTVVYDAWRQLDSERSDKK